MQVTYHLRCQRRHCAHFAKVTLELYPAQDNGRVWLDEHMSERIDEMYGSYSWEYHLSEHERRAACVAAQLVLLGQPESWDVCIQMIESRAVDRSPEAIAFAVTKALQDAFGISSSPYPRIEDGALIFDPMWSGAFDFD